MSEYTSRIFPSVFSCFFNEISKCLFSAKSLFAEIFSKAPFFNPSANYVSEPLKTCVSSDNPPMFEPMTLMDYLCWYIDTNYERDAVGKQ